jgi:hypothetical protein
MKIIFFSFLFFTFVTFTNAQTQEKQPEEKKRPNIIIVGAGKTAKFVGKTSYIVLKESAKITWQATKITTTEVSAPIAKAIIVKATPKVSAFMLKTTGKVLEKGLPIATRLLIAYLKL